MKSPEEIKKALEMCARNDTTCEECPYNPDHDYGIEDFFDDVLICNNGMEADALEYIELLEENQPKRGKWERQPVSGAFWCNRCYGWFCSEVIVKCYKYCPNCGAKMEV